ncbi:LysR substrate-binding domain-containing protein [uncultured Kiloniella sp.]|uniref:LysR substrate-binding domain-containing protein n=1 Tax=uncultured Kiloniella sp. TaxID=1133091 RepID=UPI002632DBFF|nr:LysR substrate-binding domain-containing protein [uncultured Kiloniella sp.]
MNLSQLRAFNVVAREGSLTKAAEHLSISQPAVTAHIRALEERYELSLFRRNSRGVTLTEVGEDLLEISAQIFALESEAAELLDATKELRRGTCRIAAGSPYFIVPIIAAFQERYPEVHIGLNIGNSQKVTADLLAEKVDIALQTGWEENPLVEAIPFYLHRVVVFCCHTHPWAQSDKKQIELSELSTEKMIWREPQSITRQVFEKACQEKSLDIKPTMVIAGRESLFEAVAAGLGIGIVSSHELPKDQRVHTLNITDADLETTEYLLTLKRRRELRIVKAFHEIAERFRGGL